MNKFLRVFPLLMLALAFSACGGSDDDPGVGNGNNNGGGVTVNRNVNKNVPTAGMPREITRLEFPRVQGGTSLVLVHYADVPGSQETVNYALEWDGAKKANRWTCYQMYASNRVTKTDRYEAGKNEEQYPQDPDLPEGYGFDTDPFRGTGYDHGHICPSADRLYSSEANYQTFYLTNMSPQVNGFNAGVWMTMEGKLRDWITVQSKVTDTLYVCKGGTIDNEEQILTTLDNGLIVPKYFFCALLMKNQGGYKALGFWFEHKVDRSTDLSKYVVNIDKLEELTGLDFFCNLIDETEEHVESLPVENVKRAWGLN